MRRVEVEARDDGEHQDGGHAVLLVQGVEQLDEGTSFFLRPLDAAGLEDGIGDLEHEQRATAVRRVPGGVEIVIGPEVTDLRALVPGSVVEIEIPDAGVWSEFRWPEVSARARPKRAKIVAVRPPGGEGAQARAPGGMPQPGGDGGHAAGASAPIQRPSEAAKPTIASSFDEKAIAMTTQHKAERPGAQQAGVSRQGASNPGEASDQSGNGDDYVVFYPYARGGKVGAAPASGSGSRQVASLLPTTRMGAAGMAAAALLGVQALLWLGSGGSFKALLARASPVAATVAAGPDASIYDLFAVGTVSPRGVSGRDVVPTKALENAQAALSGAGGARDTEEASYWLRRFILSAGSDERTRRVLTQLGTTFADQANRQPDYVRSRQVWELAGAFGDPVAMCFLGTLHENGLGVTADRGVALQWYERAKAAGGCPGVDDSIARTKK